MVVQGTGAMAMVIADVPALHGEPDQARAVATLALLTGAMMLLAGALKLGSLLRFVSNAVLVGFMNAVGVNIVLGQLANLTGYAATGGNRVARSLNTLLSPASLDWRSVGVGLSTVALIVAFERTRLGSMGLVVAVIATSAIAALLGWNGVATLQCLGPGASPFDVAVPRPRPATAGAGGVAGVRGPRSGCGDLRRGWTATAKFGPVRRSLATERQPVLIPQDRVLASLAAAGCPPG